MSFNEIEENLKALEPQDGLRWIDSIFGSNVKLSSALGPEAQLLTYWISKHKLKSEIFTIDTGRLFQETYDLLELTNAILKTRIRIYYPDARLVEEMVTNKGPNSFYHNVEDRIHCCNVRKVMPLKRALTGAAVWITGLRADQSQSRKHMKMVEWSDTYNVIKYNPLLNWSAEEVMNLIETHNIPTNKLHRQGFASIGCQPCTRAISKDEDKRAGRWWWENSNKECGLHQTAKLATV